MSKVCEALAPQFYEDTETKFEARYYKLKHPDLWNNLRRVNLYFYKNELTTYGLDVMTISDVKAYLGRTPAEREYYDKLIEETIAKEEADGLNRFAPFENTSSYYDIIAFLKARKESKDYE